MDFKSKKFNLSERQINYIQEYKELSEMENDSATLRLILHEHAQFKKHLFDLNYVASAVTEKMIGEMRSVLSENLLEEIRRVRLGTNNTDRNTQILLELIVSWMDQSNIEAITSTQRHKPSFLSFAESVVANKIQHQKQKKDDKANRNKGEKRFNI